MMTPQLFINYKLKSVEYLPWKALIYRFFFKNNNNNIEIEEAQKSNSLTTQLFI